MDADDPDDSFFCVVGQSCSQVENKHAVTVSREPSIGKRGTGFFVAGSQREVLIGKENYEAAHAKSPVDDEEEDSFDLKPILDHAPSEPSAPDGMRPSGFVVAGSSRAVFTSNEIYAAAHAQQDDDDEEIDESENDPSEAAAAFGMHPTGFMIAGTKREIFMRAENYAAAHTNSDDDNEAQENIENVPSSSDVADIKPPVFPGFATAGTGKALEVHEKSLERARQLLRSPNRVDEENVVSHPDPIDIKPPPFAGFTAAGSGKQVPVSETALKEVRQVLRSPEKNQEACSPAEPVDVKPPPFLGFIAAGSGKQVTVSEIALQQVREVLRSPEKNQEVHLLSEPVQTNPPPFLGFTSAGSGKQVDVSETSLKRAREVLRSPEKNLEAPLTSEPVEMKPPPFLGFTAAGSGKQVDVSETSLKRAREVLRSPEKNQEATAPEERSKLPAPGPPPPFAGFATAGSGTLVDVKPDSLRKARQVLSKADGEVDIPDDELSFVADEEPTSPRRLSLGFTNAASGKSVAVDADALSKARKRLQEADDEGDDGVVARSPSTPGTAAATTPNGRLSSLKRAATNVESSFVTPKRPANGFRAPFLSKTPASCESTSSSVNTPLSGDRSSQKGARKSSSSSQRASSQRTPTQRDISSRTLTPNIRSLIPGTIPSRIILKVLRTFTALKEVDTKKGRMLICAYVLVDTLGDQVLVKAYQEQATMLHQTLAKGEPYELLDFSCRHAMSQSKRDEWQLELVARPNSKVVSAKNPPPFASIAAAPSCDGFTPICDLVKKELDDAVVDVVGIATSHEPELIQKFGNYTEDPTAVQSKMFNITDESGYSVTVKVFDEVSNADRVEAGGVVEIVGAQVKRFQGSVHLLVSATATISLFSRDADRYGQLEPVFAAENFDYQQKRNITENIIYDEFHFIGLLKDTHTHPFAIVKAFIQLLSNTDPLCITYFGCTKCRRKCTKKDDKFKCCWRYCTGTTGRYFYRFSLTIGDFTGEIDVQVFDQIGERLLKCSADDYMSSIRGMGKAEAKYSLDNRLRDDYFVPYWFYLLPPRTAIDSSPIVQGRPSPTTRSMSDRSPAPSPSAVSSPKFENRWTLERFGELDVDRYNAFLDQLIEREEIRKMKNSPESTSKPKSLQAIAAAEVVVVPDIASEVECQ